MSPSVAATNEPPNSRHAEIAEQVIGGVVTASAPKVSLDGRQIAFVVNRVDFAKNRARAQIWIAAADGSSPPRPLSSGERSDTHPTWSPDGRNIAFVSSRSENKGESTLHVIPMDGPGEVRTVATMKDGMASVSWSPDGTWIAFTSRTRDARYEAEDESWQSPRKVERFFTRLNGEGWVFDRPSHVYVVPANGTGAPRNLTPGPFQHDGAAWLPDSSAIVTSAARHATWDIDLARDLYVMPLDGDAPTALTKQSGNYHAPAVSPDGTRVAFLGADDPLTDPQNQHVGIISLETGAMHWASRGLDRTFASTAGASAPVWLDADTVLAAADDRGRGHIYSVGTDGADAPVAVTDGQRWVRSFDAKAGTIAMCVSSVDRPAELAVIVDGEERRLTDLSAPYVATMNRSAGSASPSRRSMGRSRSTRGSCVPRASSRPSGTR